MPYRSVTAFAPGSVGNLGPGLDILGLAVEGIGDEVTARPAARAGVVIQDPGHPDLPSDPARHAAGIAAAHVLARAGVDAGVELLCRKGLPLSGGQGGSAASAVAGAVAVNALFSLELGAAALLAAGFEAERVLAGPHGDNVAPALLGGATLVRALDPPDVVRLPVPEGLTVVLAHPDQRLRTADARAALPDAVPLALALAQAADIAALVAALSSGDLALLGRALRDRIAEPARARLLPGFEMARRAALDAGAIGSSISGAGPTAFALAAEPAAGARVAGAMRDAYARAGVAAATSVHQVDRRGARATHRHEAP